MAERVGSSSRISIYMRPSVGYIIICHMVGSA